MVLLGFVTSLRVLERILFLGSMQISLVHVTISRDRIPHRDPLIRTGEKHLSTWPCWYNLSSLSLGFEELCAQANPLSSPASIPIGLGSAPCSGSQSGLGLDGFGQDYSGVRRYAGQDRVAELHPLRDPILFTLLVRVAWHACRQTMPCNCWCSIIAIQSQAC